MLHWLPQARGGSEEDRRRASTIRWPIGRGIICNLVNVMFQTPLLPPNASPQGAAKCD